MCNFNENYTLFQIDSDRPDRTDVCDLVFVVVECWYKWDENIRSHLLLPGTHLNRFWRFSGAHWWSFYFSTPGGSFQSGGQTNNDLKGCRSRERRWRNVLICPSILASDHHWRLHRQWQLPTTEFRDDEIVSLLDLLYLKCCIEK